MIPATSEGPAACCAGNRARWPGSEDPEVHRLRVGRDLVLVVRGILEVPVRLAVQAYRREAGCLGLIGSPHYFEAAPGESLGDVTQRAFARVLAQLRPSPSVVTCAIGASLSVSNEKAGPA